MKRSSLTALAALLLCAAAPPEPLTQTTAGPVTGLTLQDGVRAWLGIPFAAPPVRDARWKPPGPVLSWTRPFHADRIAPECLQPMRQHEYNHYFGDEPQSEDCLYLNIWSPKRSNKSLPVIVWIHGGSFIVGSGGKALFDGAALAMKGAVVVTINYRLGALGFLAHPALTAESPQHASGNYGLQDQIAALKWVHQNAAAFGGDATKVTIMGQSAGAIAISDLQVSPLAHGLFQRIIAMSGSAYSATFKTQPLAAAEQQGVAFTEQFKTQSLRELRLLPADEVARAPFQASRPIIDGWIIPRSPEIQYARGEAVDVPILLGFTRDENLGPLAAVRTLADYRSVIARQFAAQANAILALYPVSGDKAARAIAQTLGRDLSFNMMMRNWARLQVHNGRAPVWAYEFSQEHPYVRGITFADMDPMAAGIYHTAAVPYFFGTLESFNLFRDTRKWRPVDRELSDKIMTGLASFATTGNPNYKGGAIWPRYVAADERVLVLDDKLETASWPNAPRLDALQNIMNSLDLQ